MGSLRSLTAVEQNRQHEDRAGLASEGLLQGGVTKLAPQGYEGRRR